MATTTMTKRGADNHNMEDPPQEGQICKEGQGKEEGLASAEEVRHAAIQVDDGNMAFLLMAEATVATATVLLSTIPLGALSSLGAGMTTIIPVVDAVKMPWTTTMTMSWLRSWWGPDNRNNVAAPIVNGGDFWFGLSLASQSGGSSFGCIKLLCSQVGRYSV